MKQDIHDLLANVAQGSMHALGELYDLLSARVFNYAKTITQNREMAEDITHDVFLQVNRHALRIAKAADPVAYMMTMTRNHYYDLIKRNGPPNVSLDDISGLRGYAAPDSLLFENAFATLPASQREAVYLHLICGFTHEEAANIQGVPLVTVKWRYGKALEQLKAYFALNGMEENYNEPQ